MTDAKNAANTEALATTEAAEKTTVVAAENDKKRARADGGDGAEKAEPATKVAADLPPFQDYLDELGELDFIDDAAKESEDKLTLCLLVKSSAVGAVIGKGGIVIREVQTVSGARVQFQRKTDPQLFADGSKMTINGTVVEAVKAAHLVARLVDTAARNEEGEQPVAMMVPETSVGLVIGKKGATIRELQEKSGCTMSISREMVHPEVKLLVMTGDAKARAQAVSAALSLLKERAELPEGVGMQNPQQMNPQQMNPQQMRMQQMGMRRPQMIQTQQKPMIPMGMQQRAGGMGMQQGMQPHGMQQGMQQGMAGGMGMRQAAMQPLGMPQAMGGQAPMQAQLQAQQNAQRIQQIQQIQAVQRQQQQQQMMYRPM